MSDCWRNSVETALGAGICAVQSPRASRCGEHAQALAACICPSPVSQWGQDGLRRPLVTSGNSPSCRMEPFPRACSEVGNDVTNEM